MNEQTVIDCEATLLAVADCLVFKALETMGKRLVRTERSRYRIIGDAPFHMAHTIWQVDDAEAARSLRGAWDVVPLLIERHCGECGVEAASLIEVLDEYVRDLVITGTPHHTPELAYRFRARLGSEEPEDEPSAAGTKIVPITRRVHPARRMIGDRR